jgi:acetyl/propionyl-CoA carboxylase alpha subunit
VVQAAGYVNAGTVEFLVDRDLNFYFLEVNTRLQVEHPVTEMVTGLDLVRLQIEIASGKPLPLSQEEVAGRGHALECRIYAEDPENDFLPCPGTVLRLHEPSGPGVRNDCGIFPGCPVPVEYDPILSKLVVHAGTRDAAVARMLRALEEYLILGVRTPIPFLIDVIRSEAFRSGETCTDFIQRNFPDWKPRSDALDLACAAYVIDELSRPEAARSSLSPEPGPDSPWKRLGNWRL